MKISIFSVGKANESYIKEGVEQFTKRIGHYYPIDWQLITPSKLTEPVRKSKKQKPPVY
jgi:23S rRNA (pseudouridine1915-N3)-methyltransferase